MTVAIVVGGVIGLRCAYKLSGAGAEVTVIERDSCPCQRASSLRAPSNVIAWYVASSCFPYIAIQRAAKTLAAAAPADDENAVAVIGALAELHLA